MSKHIKLFNTEVERATYENGSTFIYPYVSLSEDTKNVSYSRFFVPLKQAQIGDIILEGNYVVRPSNYDKIKNWRSAIGIVGIPKNVIPDNKLRVVSLDYMSIVTPFTGSNTTESMYWGPAGNITGLTNLNQIPIIRDSNSNLSENIQSINTNGYIPNDSLTGEQSLTTGLKYSTNPQSLPVPSIVSSNGSLNSEAIATEFTIPGTSTVSQIANPLSDFNGEQNTSIISELITEENISDSSEDYTAVHSCILYNKGNLNWILPSCGELTFISTYINKINTSRQIIGLNNLDNEDFWTSTINSSDNICTVNISNGHINYGVRPNDKCNCIAISTL